MRLIPRVSAVLIAQSVDYNDGTRRGQRMDHGTDDGSRNYGSCRDSGGRCNRMIAAASAVVAPSVISTVNVVVYVDVAIDIHIDVTVDIRILVDVRPCASTITLGE